MRATPMKMTVDGQYVSIKYTDDFTGEPVERLFTCPSAGGHVREIAHYQDAGNTVCKRLSHTGHPIIAPSTIEFPTIIRREFDAMRAAERRAAAKSRGW